MAAKKYDLVILGGGIAGMTAAIYAARANLSTAIVETNICGGLVNSTYVVENVPSYPRIHGMELMEKVREHVDTLGVVVEEAAEVEELRLDGSVKCIRTDEDSYEAAAVILATGRKPIPLDIGDDCEQIHYCSICDGAAYRDRKVLVVGGGNSGFDEALYLLDLGVRELVLVEKMDRFFAAQATVDALSARENVRVEHTTSVQQLVGEGRLAGAVLKNEKTGALESIDLDGIFVFMGQTPNTDMFAGKVDMDDQGYIITDDDMRTSLPGIYAAGDVRPKKYRQITTAMSDGTIAALEAGRYIRET